VSHRYYDAQYEQIADRLLAEVRRETWGEDIGQNSWLTVAEYRQFIGWLSLSASSNVLDVGSGSGGPALFLVRETGCRVVGIDVNRNGIEAANRLSESQGLGSQARFQPVDAAEVLPFDNASFDAIICIDAINHLRDRARVLNDWARVLRPAGTLLFTDPIIVSGILANDEIATRSSIGFFLFTPEGTNERMLREAGFQLVKAEDCTANTATVAQRFYSAREKRRDALIQVEGAETFAGTQRFLEVAHRLSAERRLLRVAFLSRKV
jgi:SAM-dependent methyltransferase